MDASEPDTGGEKKTPTKRRAVKLLGALLYAKAMDSSPHQYPDIFPKKETQIESLKDLLGIGPVAFSRTLQHAKIKGWVKAARKEEDHRQMILTPTEKGERFFFNSDGRISPQALADLRQISSMEEREENFAFLGSFYERSSEGYQLKQAALPLSEVRESLRLGPTAMSHLIEKYTSGGKKP